VLQVEAGEGPIDVIPVLLHNSGQALWEANGSLGFIGEDPYQMGYKAAELHAAHGVKKGLCFNQVPGNHTVEARCTGYSEAMTAAGRETVLHTIGTGDATNPEALLQALKGILNADPSIDAVHTLGFQVALAAVQAADDLGRKGQIYISSTDISAELLNAIKAGDVAFTMDQQPYLQGFMSMRIASQYLTYARGQCPGNGAGGGRGAAQRLQTFLFAVAPAAT
jgi:simple sugar transport system substrate-binding protein